MLRHLQTRLSSWDIFRQSSTFLQKMLQHLHTILSSWLNAISSSWDSFRQSNTFLQKAHQQLRSRSVPSYLAFAACLTTLVSVLFLSLGRIRYHWDNRIWDADITLPQGSIVQSSPRDMAANDTLGVSLTICKEENRLHTIMMI